MRSNPELVIAIVGLMVAILACIPAYLGLYPLFFNGEDETTEANKSSPTLSTTLTNTSQPSTTPAPTATATFTLEPSITPTSSYTPTQLVMATNTTSIPTPISMRFP